MPNTSGRVNFHARVAANVVEMVRRELATRETHLWNEWDGLNSLLGEEPRQMTLSALPDAIERRNRDLADRIRGGDYDNPDDRAVLLAHLRRVTLNKIAVTNPALAAQEAAPPG